jgi:hypothetical protein
MRFWTLQAGIALTAIVGFAVLGAPACGTAADCPADAATDVCGRNCGPCVCDPGYGQPCSVGGPCDPSSNPTGCAAGLMCVPDGGWGMCEPSQPDGG